MQISFDGSLFWWLRFGAQKEAEQRRRPCWTLTFLEENKKMGTKLISIFGYKLFNFFNLSKGHLKNEWRLSNILLFFLLPQGPPKKWKWRKIKKILEPSAEASVYLRKSIVEISLMIAGTETEATGFRVFVLLLKSRYSTKKLSQGILSNRAFILKLAYFGINDCGYPRFFRRSFSVPYCSGGNSKSEVEK